MKKISQGFLDYYDKILLHNVLNRIQLDKISNKPNSLFVVNGMILGIIDDKGIIKLK